MYTQEEVFGYVEENDVQFIRISFLDIFGTMKNISVRPQELAGAFGEGIAFDAFRIAGFEAAGSELFLVPDPATLSILPWRPQSGRVVRLMSAILERGGASSPYDTRQILASQAARMREAGLYASLTVNSTFCLLCMDNDGNATFTPADSAGYLDIAPLDKGENLRREVSFALEQMGITPRTSCHEAGPGQNALTYEYAGPVRAAENFAAFKSLVRTIASQNGLFASFLPRLAGGLHPNSTRISLQLSEGARGLDFGQDAKAMAFAAGIRRRAAAICAFFAPTPLSGPDWTGGGIEVEGTQLHLCFADGAMSPYLAFALLLAAGMEGIETGTENAQEKPQDLPGTLSEALDAADSPFTRQVVGDGILSAFTAAKRAQIAEAASLASQDPSGEQLARKFFPLA